MFDDYKATVVNDTLLEPNVSLINNTDSFFNPEDDYTVESVESPTEVLPASATTADVKVKLRKQRKLTNGDLIPTDKYEEHTEAVTTLKEQVTREGVFTWLGKAINWDLQLKKMSNPTKVTYIDGSTVEYDIVGELTSGSCPFKASTAVTVEIGDDVTSISGCTYRGVSTFSNCTNLTSVTIPDSVISIGDYTFSACTSLKSVTIGTGVTYIGVRAFSGCTNLTSVIIPNSVTSIGDDAFDKCTSLTSVTIGTGVTSIVNSAFFGCTNLTSVGEKGSGCSVEIPNSVTSIGECAFIYCGLTSVTIPDSVTSIVEQAFSSCKSLTSITIPDSVTSIGGYAFESCTKLTSIIYKGTKSKWNAITKGIYWHKNVPSTTVVTCTDGTVELD